MSTHADVLRARSIAPRGFTLVELAVVVAIVAVLAALAVSVGASRLTVMFSLRPDALS